MKSTCIGRRSQREVADLPCRETCPRAAFIFAGTRATNKRATHPKATFVPKTGFRPNAWQKAVIFVSQLGFPGPH
jgi:hypothetical protein